MADLHQIIYPHAGSNNRIAARTAINAAIGPNLRAIANDDAAKLRHCHMLALSIGDKTKAFIANARALVQHHTIPSEAIFHTGMGMDAPMVAKLAARANRSVMFQDAMRTNFGAGADVNEGADLTAWANHRIGRDHRAGVNAGLRLCGRMKQAGDLNEAGLRGRDYQRDASRRHLLREALLNQYRASLACLQCGQIPPAFHEGDIIRPSQMQRSDTSKLAHIIFCRRQSKCGADGS
jgi:hypothetical protein